ncbi:hypothetical protein BH10BAC2_BH10BAC2_11050 [soil metagenome]
MKKNLSLTSVLLLCTVLCSTQLFAQQRECTGFRTQTQGGWGAKPNGNNPGVYLHANFAAAFPGSLTIGCGSNKLTLTSAQAVTDFLPSGSTPSLLPAGSMVDPGGSYSNVLAGQLVTAILNAGFDANDPNFSSNAISTGNLVIVSGTFAGLTINQLIDAANNVIGGCSTAYSTSDLNEALTSFNENYDNGATDNGYTTCSVPCTIKISGSQKDVSCNGDNNGAIDITVSGANGTVSYLWNDGNTDEDRTGLAAGTYSVTVADAKGCEANASFTIAEPDALNVSGITADISTVGGNDGSIDLTVTGGTAPYSYLWDDGSTDKDRTGLAAGTYNVTITDAHGCSTKAFYILKQPECNIAVSGTTTNIKCYGGNTGTIDITVTGANGTATYLWNDGNTSEDRSNLVAGTYSVTVTDAAKCTATASFTITQPLKALKVRSLVTNTTAPKVCDGKAELKVTGGTSPYTIVWSDGGLGKIRTGLCARTYTVTITDANGCVVICKVRVACSYATQIAASTSSSLITRNDVTATVSPNPTKGIVKLSLTAKTTNTAVINIYDMNGKKMFTEKFAVAAGTINKTLDFSKYSKGLYNIEVIADGEKKLVKIMVQ